MTENLKKTIQEEIIKLPKESQSVINTFGWENISEKIGKKYLLNEEEINILQAEIAVVLLGVDRENDLSMGIEEEVGVSKNEAIKIASDIEKEILQPMLIAREKLIKNNMPFKNPTWKQTVNFIVSGGDYSAFIG